MVEKKRVAYSLLFSFIAEIANKIFPLIIIHYVQLKLGLKQFGYAQFGIYLVDLSLPFVAWGYHTLGPLKIGKNRDNVKQVEKIIGTIVFLKVIHALFASTFLIAFISISDEYRAYLPIVLALSFIYVTHAFDMTFVLVGMQRMTSFIKISVLAKSISLICVLLFIHDSDDAVLFAVLSFGANGLVSLGTCFLSMRIFPRIFPDRSKIKSYFIQSIPLGFSYILIYFFDRIDYAIVEPLLGMKGVGLYAGPKRIQQSLLPVITMVGTIFFSEMVLQKGKKALTEHVYFGLQVMLIIILPICVGVWFVDSTLLKYIVGQRFSAQGTVLSILVSSIFVQALIIIFGHQVLIIKGRIKLLNIAIVIGILIALLLGYLLGVSLGLKGIALSVLLGRVVTAIIILACASKYIHKLPIKGILKVFFPGVVLFGSLYFLSIENSLITIIVGAFIYISMVSLMNFKLVKKMVLSTMNK